MSLDFSDIKVLLIGDFMVDQYVLCTSTRMSPEAPVPVLNPDKIYSSPGGAGNVAINLSELGANVTCVGDEFPWQQSKANGQSIRSRYAST